MADYFQVQTTSSPEEDLAYQEQWNKIEQMRSKYNYNTRLYDLVNYHDLYNFLMSESIPEERKQAVLAQLNSIASSLPEHSWTDEWSEGLFGTSNYKKTLLQMSGQAGKLIGEAINSNYEEKYNAASAQADRERQAGINPDIAGVSSQAAGAATDTNEMSAPFQAPDSMSGDAILSGFSNTVMSGLQLITGFVGQIQNWISSDISNATNEVLLDNEVRKNIREAFTTVINDEDQLNMQTFKLVRDYYGKDYPQLGADNIKTREDLDKFISEYNKQPNIKKIGIEDLYGSAILQAAKNYENPFHGVRARRAYDRSINAIQPNSPYVQSLYKSLQAQASGAAVDNERNLIEFKELLGGYGDLVRQSYSILQEAENEYNKFTRRYYAKRNGKVQYTNEDGEVSESDFSDLQLGAEAQALYSDKMNSLANQYQKKLQEALRETFSSKLAAIEKEKGKDSWQYELASIIYPAVVSYLEKDALQQIGAVFSRPAPSPRNTQIINNRDSHNVTSIDNNF